MSKLKLFAMVFVCGVFCLGAFGSSWAANYTVTVNNDLPTTGDPQNVNSTCSIVKLSVHGKGVQSTSLTSPLKGGSSGTLNISADSCNRLQLDVKCNWYSGILEGWRDTSATANWDCNSGTAKIVDDNGLSVKAPAY